MHEARNSGNSRIQRSRYISEVSEVSRIISKELIKIPTAIYPWGKYVIMPMTRPFVRHLRHVSLTDLRSDQGRDQPRAVSPRPFTVIQWPALVLTPTTDRAVEILQQGGMGDGCMICNSLTGPALFDAGGPSRFGASFFLSCSWNGTVTVVVPLYLISTPYISLSFSQYLASLSLYFQIHQLHTFELQTFKHESSLPLHQRS